MPTPWLQTMPMITKDAELGPPERLRCTPCSIKRGQQYSRNSSCYASGITAIEEAGKATAMALLCAPPHNGTHKLWFDYKSCSPKQNHGPSTGQGWIHDHLAEKDCAKFIGSKLKASPVRSGGLGGDPSDLAEKQNLATCFSAGTSTGLCSPQVEVRRSPRPRA